MQFNICRKAWRTTKTQLQHVVIMRVFAPFVATNAVTLRYGVRQTRGVVAAHDVLEQAGYTHVNGVGSQTLNEFQSSPIEACRQYCLDGPDGFAVCHSSAGLEHKKNTEAMRKKRQKVGNQIKSQSGFI